MAPVRIVLGQLCGQIQGVGVLQQRGDTVEVVEEGSDAGLGVSVEVGVGHVKLAFGAEHGDDPGLIVAGEVEDQLMQVFGQLLPVAIRCVVAVYVAVGAVSRLFKHNR